jgi:hypothetical protein
MNDLMAQIASHGLLNSINHPLPASWAWCYQHTVLGNVQCLEIWNDPSWADNVRANPRAIDLWAGRLNAGQRITAIGGSDFHRPIPKSGKNKPSERVGRPSTYVYAENLSGSAILKSAEAAQSYREHGPSGYVSGAGQRPEL